MTTTTEDLDILVARRRDERIRDATYRELMQAVLELARVDGALEGLANCSAAISTAHAIQKAKAVQP